MTPQQEEAYFAEKRADVFARKMFESDGVWFVAFGLRNKPCMLAEDVILEWCDQHGIKALVGQSDGVIRFANEDDALLAYMKFAKKIC